MKKYSILSIASEQFEDFLRVFLESAVEKLDLNHIHEICILDIGLPVETTNYFKKLNPKIKFLKSEEILIPEEYWDESWQKNVLKKIEFVKSYLLEKNVPVFMVDIDCMFLKDTSDILNFKEDIVLCDRTDLWADMPYIASFVAFLNIEQSIKFIDEWIDLRDKMDKFKTKETPALNELIGNNTKYDLASLSHNIVGLYWEYLLIPETKIIHFKGGGYKNDYDSIMDRFDRFKKFNETVVKYLEEGLG
jgi:hypothetical protein